MEFRPRVTQGLPADFAVPPVARAERPEVLRGPRRDFAEQAQRDAATYRPVLVRYYCSDDASCAIARGAIFDRPTVHRTRGMRGAMAGSGRWTRTRKRHSRTSRYTLCVTSGSSLGRCSGRRSHRVRAKKSQFPRGGAERGIASPAQARMAAKKKTARDRGGCGGRHSRSRFQLGHFRLLSRDVVVPDAAGHRRTCDVGD